MMKLELGTLMRAKYDDGAFEALLAWLEWNDRNGYYRSFDYSSIKIEFVNYQLTQLEEYFWLQKFGTAKGFRKGWLVELSTALENFKAATKKLADLADKDGDAWNAVLEGEYPESLPSFDEFYFETISWELT